MLGTVKLRNIIILKFRNPDNIAYIPLNDTYYSQRKHDYKDHYHGNQDRCYNCGILYAMKHEFMLKRRRR